MVFPILADALMKNDPVVKTVKGVEQIYCGHCGYQLHYKTDESCTLFTYVVYECKHCKREFNHAKRFPRKVV